MERAALPYIIGVAGAVGGYFFFDWLQDAMPRTADGLFVLMLLVLAWTLWPRRRRATRGDEG